MTGNRECLDVTMVNVGPDMRDPDPKSDLRKEYENLLAKKREKLSEEWNMRLNKLWFGVDDAEED